MHNSVTFIDTASSTYSDTASNLPEGSFFTGRLLLLALLLAHRLRFNSLRLFLSICSSRKASLEAVSDMSGSVRPVTVDRVAAAYGRGTFCVPRPGRVRNVFRQMHEDINAPPCTQRDILPVHVNMILTQSMSSFDRKTFGTLNMSSMLSCLRIRTSTCR